MWARLLLGAGLLFVTAGGANAQVASTSQGPAGVSVTVYRNPARNFDQSIDLDWVEGYALISEVRRIAIPAGDSEIRFEGVAGGIIPESAIVTGLPDGVIEKNQDAYLLSPASLLERSLGKRVHLRRTSKATGEVREEVAIVRSGAAGAVVLQTKDGFEALRCTGLPETIVYDGVPEGLAAKPTLSVRTRSREATEATVTLSYLATGFDWQANYIAQLAPSGDKMDLFAWITLANGDETSFIDAATQTVAGRPNRLEDEESDQVFQRAELRLDCWPSGRTSDIQGIDAITAEDIGRFPDAAPAPALQRLAESIVVTGIRMNKAQQEELGDLKLYRIPERVTVAANSQKQVALLEQKNVKVESLVRGSVILAHSNDSVTLSRIFKTKNRKQEGLGLPLPAGGVALFAGGASRPLLIGEGAIDDRAVGEDVEIRIPDPPGITANLTYQQDEGAESQRSETYDAVLTATNDRPTPVLFEAEFEQLPYRDVRIESSSAKLPRRKGKPVWSVTIPANGTVTLKYRIVERERGED